MCVKEPFHEVLAFFERCTFKNRARFRFKSCFCSSPCTVDSRSRSGLHHYSGNWRKLSNRLPSHRFKFPLTGEILHTSHNNFLHSLLIPVLQPHVCCIMSLFPCLCHKLVTAVRKELHQQQLVWQVQRASLPADGHHDLVTYDFPVCCCGALWRFER